MATYRDPIICNKTTTRQARVMNLIPAYTMKYLIIIAPITLLLMAFISPPHAMVIGLCCFVACWILMGGDRKRRWQFNARRVAPVALTLNYSDHEPLFDTEEGTRFRLEDRQ